MAENNNVYKMIQDLADTVVDKFATKTSVTQGLAGKQDAGEYAPATGSTEYATKTELAGKADAAGLSVYLTEANAEATYATKTEITEAGYAIAADVETALAGKADAAGLSVYLTEANAEATYATKEQVAQDLAGKADAAGLSVYLTEANAEATYQPIGDYAPATGSTEYATKTELATKTDKEVNGTNGKSLIFNENDGGGAKFENSDGIRKSFAGVNDGEAGIYAQLYAIEKQNGKSRGAKFDVTLGGIYYTTGDDSEGAPTDRDVAANEIATKGDITAAIGELPAGFTNIVDYIDSLINNNGN